MISKTDSYPTLNSVIFDIKMRSSLQVMGISIDIDIMMFKIYIPIHRWNEKIKCDKAIISDVYELGHVTELFKV
jgi:hypothetical protein